MTPFRYNGWILGNFYKDLLFVFSPGFIGVALSALIPQQTIFFILWAFFVTVLVDSGHVFTTAWRTFFRKEERTSSPIYWIVPTLIVLIVFMWVKFKIPYIWSFVVYATVYHHMTQFYGFLRWYQKLNGKRLILSAYFLFALMIIPFVLLHFRALPKHGLYTDQDIFFYPNPHFFKTGLVVYGLVAGVWLFWEAVSVWRRTFEIHCFLAVLCPAFLYGACFLLGQNMIQVLFPLLLSHGIPYVAVMGLSLPRLDRRLFSSMPKALAILAATAVIGSVIEKIYENFVITIDNEYTRSGLSSLQALLIGIYLVPVLCHYIFDGVIWKSTHKDAKLIYAKEIS